METNPFNWKPGFLEDLSSLSGHLQFQVVAIPAQDSFLQVQPTIRWPPEHLVQLVLSLVAGLTSLLLLLLVLSYSFMILQSQLQYYYSVKLFLYYSVVAAAVLVLGASFVASQVPFTVRYPLISLSQLPQVLSFREDLPSLSGPSSSSQETQDSFPFLVLHGNKRQPFIEVVFGCSGTSFLVCFLNFPFLWPHIVHKWKPVHLTGNLDSLRIHPHSQATLPFNWKLGSSERSRVKLHCVMTLVLPEADSK